MSRSPAAPVHAGVALVIAVALAPRDARADGAQPVGFDFFSPKSGGTTLAMLALRVTSTSVDGQNGVDREVDAVGAQLGGRALMVGSIDFITVRGEALAFAGGGRDGLDAEGMGHFALGLAHHLGDVDALFARLGVGGRALGNSKLDVEVAEAPALELGVQHHAKDLFLEVAPTAAFVPAVHVGAGATTETDVGIAPLVGGRAMLAAEPAWVALDYAAVVDDGVLHLGGGSLCLAPNGLAGCLDARFVVARAYAGRPPQERDLFGAYAGLSIGWGGGEVEK